MSDQIRIDTPESVDLALEPAGLGSRFLAAVIDGLIQGGATVLLILILIPAMAVRETIELFQSEIVGGVFVAILLLLLGFLFFGYKLVLEAFWNGQTVGKRAVGIRVLKQNGLPVDFLQVLVRNLMRLVDYLPFYYLVGSVAVLASRKSQRLGDMVAGTVVVREKKATMPTLPQRLSVQAPYDLNVLREHVLRLSEADVEPARQFWERRMQLEQQARYRVAASIMQALVTRMGWQETTMVHPEFFIETVLFVRAR
jgi:uncharacterized RDD family membrane protein YckC